MKNLFVFAFLLVGLFSCTDSTSVELDREAKEDVELPQELKELLGNIQTRSDWPKSSYSVAEFLNQFDFTPDNYLGCESELISVSYGPEEMEGADGFPLSSIVADATYSISHFNTVLIEFWKKVKMECPGNFVIVNAEFYSYFDQDEYLSHLGVNLEICCSPILGPNDPRDPREEPHHDGPGF